MTVFVRGFVGVTERSKTLEGLFTCKEKEEEKKKAVKEHMAERLRS